MDAERKLSRKVMVDKGLVGSGWWEMTNDEKQMPNQ